MFVKNNNYQIGSQINSGGNFEQLTLFYSCVSENFFSSVTTNNLTITIMIKKIFKVAEFNLAHDFETRTDSLVDVGF